HFLQRRLAGTAGASLGRRSHLLSLFLLHLLLHFLPLPTLHLILLIRLFHLDFLLHHIGYRRLLHFYRTLLIYRILSLEKIDRRRSGRLARTACSLLDREFLPLLLL
ncbi:hypothetical protein PENTCL1PPCAC_15232, partial [Pristionchus entomophagus]